MNILFYIFGMLLVFAQVCVHFNFVCSISCIISRCFINRSILSFTAASCWKQTATISCDLDFLQSVFYYFILTSTLYRRFLTVSSVISTLYGSISSAVGRRSTFTSNFFQNIMFEQMNEHFQCILKYRTVYLFIPIALCSVWVL